MTQLYEKKAEQIKANLLQMFKFELAKLYDTYLQNRKMCERVIQTDKGLLNLVLSQELQLGGIESEFSLRRVPRIQFGENEHEIDPD